MDARLLRTLVDDGYIPVVASVAADVSGQALNVNADIAAGEACPVIPSLPQKHVWCIFLTSLLHLRPLWQDPLDRSECTQSQRPTLPLSRPAKVSGPAFVFLSTFLA